MKVAVTAQDRELSSPVDPRFGRAKCFIVLDMGATGTVADAVEQFKAGKLRQSRAADMEGHWV